MKTTKILTILVLALALMVWPGQEASGGTLAAWGIDDGSDTDYGQVTDVPAGNDFVAIAGGIYHSLALKSDGSLVAWGIDDGSTYDYGQVTDVPSGNDFVAVAGGGYHSLALKSDGSLAAWGDNRFNQCDVPAGNDFVAIAAGNWHSLAIKSDGSLVAWVSNYYGQCDVPAGNDFVAVAGGSVHSLALKSDGSLAAWGFKNDGRCDVPAGNDFVAIAGGGSHSLALKADGSLAAWGIDDGSASDYGQVTDVPAGSDFAAIAAGTSHSLVLKSDGSLAAWGIDDGSAFDYGQVTDVPPGNDFVAVAADSHHSLAIAAAPMGTAFTYQGNLNDAGSPADGLYDFEFSLFNAPNGGIQQGNTIDINDLGVIDGYFTVELDFGSNVFDGNSVWLEIDVRPGDSNDVHTTLSPRTELTPTPYALYAENVDPDDDWIISGYDMYSAVSGNVGIGTSTPEARLSIQMRGSSQPIYPPYNLPGLVIKGGSFNIGNQLEVQDRSGNTRFLVDSGGNVGIGTTNPAEKLDVNGNININSVYKIGGDTVLSVLGSYNTFVGRDAGYSNTTGHHNTFLGQDAGFNNTEGYYNTFLGKVAGFNNTEGNSNTFSGYQAGYSNTTGYYNTFLGQAAGYYNTTGHYNTFLGTHAGVSNTEGNSNTFLGNYAGRYNTTGHNNTFLGCDAGYSNEGGGDNTYLGYCAGYFNTTGGYNIFLGVGVGFWNTTGYRNVFIGSYAGNSNTRGYDNTFLGTNAGFSNETGAGNVFIGYRAGYNETGSNKLYIANSDAGPPLIYGDFSTGRVGIGTRFPTEKLTVCGGNILIERADGTDVVEIGEGLDYAEGFDVSESTKIDAGSVLIIDADNPGKLAISDKAYDTKVAGIVAGAKGQGSGVRLGAGQFDLDVALAGRVYCNVDATEAAVQPGDLLTTSAKPGYAMKAADYMRAQGAILGKAMEKLEKGQKGQILVLVTLQ